MSSKHFATMTANGSVKSGSHYWRTQCLPMNTGNTTKRFKRKENSSHRTGNRRKLYLIYPFLMNTYTGELSPNIRLIEDGFMTRDMCLEAHKKCCDFLHAQNPFAEDRDYLGFMSQAPVWITLIAKLLDWHIFRLLGSDDFYVVIMHDKILGGDYPTMGKHNLVKLPPKIQAELRGEGQ